MDPFAEGAAPWDQLLSTPLMQYYATTQSLGGRTAVWRRGERDRVSNGFDPGTSRPGGSRAYHRAPIKHS